MEDIKVKKGKEFSWWILIVALISKEKKIFKRALFESDLLNLLIAIMFRKLMPQSFYLSQLFVISIISSV